jgi:predicted dehydrogenase
VYVSFRAHRSIPRLGSAFSTKAIAGGGALVTYKPDFPMSDMFQNEIDSFVRCIETGEKLPSHIDTVIITAQMMQAIYDSSATGKEIML